MAKPIQGYLRRVLQVAVVVVGLGVLMVPPLVLVLSGTDWSKALWAALRLAALEAFSLVFIDITTGSFRTLFVRVYKGRQVQHAHVAVALVGFVLGVGHGLMAFVFGVSGYSDALWIGPIALFVIAAVIVTALKRIQLRRSWRWVHRPQRLGLRCCPDPRSLPWLRPAE